MLDRIRATCISDRWPHPTVHTTAAVLLLSCMAAGALAADGGDPGTDAPWLDAAPLEAPAEIVARTARAIDTDDEQADVAILYRRTHISFDDDGRRSESEHMLYRVLTPAGAETWGSVDAAWSPWHEERPEIRARVIAANDRVHVLADATLSDRPAADGDPIMFGDRRVLEAPLPAVEVGSVVETFIRQSEHKPFFPSGHVSRHYLVSTQPIAHAEVLIEAPEATPLRFDLQRPPGAEAPNLNPQESTANGQRRVALSYRQMPAADSVSEGLPSDTPRWPALLVSTGKDWQTIAAAYADIVDQRLTGAEAALAPLMPAEDLTSLTARTAAMLSSLHEHVRYTGLELGEASIVPAPPADVLERRFGDCKDQATLLVGMLRREGIPAYVALLNAGTGLDVSPELPGLGGFNHAIVYVPGLRPLWIDPTQPHARVGELPVSDQDRWALVAAPGTEGLVKIPATSMADNGQTEIREVFLAPLGNGRLVETTIYRGTNERQQRRSHESSSAETRRESYVSYVETAYLEGELASFEESAYDDLDAPYTLTLETESNGRAITDVHEAAVGIPLSLFLFDMPDAFFGDGETPREQPLVMVPYTNRWQYRIHPPRGFVPREIPKDETTTLGAASLARQYRYEDGVLHAEFTFESGPRTFAAETFESTRDALYSAATDDDVVLLWFDHEALAKMGQGEADTAVRLLDGAIAARETDQAAAIERLRLTRVLIAVGMRDAAHAEIARGAADDPERSRLHQALGEVLLHDAIGRKWGAATIDHPGALAAFEKAIELDPDNANAHAELMLALERNTEGTRYGEGADLESAIAAMQHFREHFDNPSADGNLTKLLLLTEQGEALRALAESTDDANTAALRRLLATALEDDDDATLRMASRLSRDGPTLAAQLAEAAGALFAIRRYETAAGLLRMAATHAESPAATLAYAESLGKVRPFESIPEPEDPLNAFIHRLFRSFADEDSLVIEDLVHPDVLEAFANEDFATEVSEIQQTLSQQAIDEEIAPEVIFDFALSGIEMVVEREAAGLIETTMRFSVPGFGDEAETLYLGRDGDTMKLLGSSDPGDAAPALLTLIDAGRLDMAKTWLDWMRAKRTLLASDDPFWVIPFQGLWSEGDAADAEAMRIATAALFYETDDDSETSKRWIAKARTILDRTLANTAEDDPSWPILAHTAYDLCSRLEDDEAVATLAASMHAYAPTSDVAFRQRIAALMAIDDHVTARTLVQARLDAAASENDRQEAMRLLGRIAFVQRDREMADRWFSSLDQRNTANAVDLNNHAWMLLFDPSTEERALAVAQRAAEMSEYADDASLHTLAATFAANGRPTEAYRVLLQVLAAREEDTVEDFDYLVMGLIAESVGRGDDARTYYARVHDDDEDEGAFGSYELATLRLAALDAES